MERQYLRLSQIASCLPSSTTTYTNAATARCANDNDTLVARIEVPFWR
jgi:hypothetical protein